MPAAESTDPCPSDCLCQTRTYAEVVPYREEATEDTTDLHQLDCPTDELLLHTWRRNGCIRCLTWWVERVWKDPRYVRIVRGVQRKWPKVEVEDLRQLVTADIYSGNVQCWKNVGAYFRRALSNKAFDAHLRRVREETNAVELGKVAPAADAEPSLTPRLKALEECLTRLSEEEVRLKEAVYDQGRPVTEIAKARGTSYDAVLKRLSRLRKKLGDCIRSKV